MTIQELKNKATAGELALIEKVESIVSKEVALKTSKEAIRWCLSNPPPSDSLAPLEEGETWPKTTASGYDWLSESESRFGKIYLQ